MNDLELQNDIKTMLAVLVIIGIAFTIWSGAIGQKHSFMKDCGEMYSQEHCEELWEMGND